MTANEHENQPGYVGNFWIDELDYTTNGGNETSMQNFSAVNVKECNII